MRYFAEMAYHGAAYHGWQRQPHRISIQEKVEEAFSTILRVPLEVVGCGRTDTGVHARQYFFHFDFEGGFPARFLTRLNKFLPPDIAVYRIFPVDGAAHARYDAQYRAYAYYLDFRKNPFSVQTSYQYLFPRRPVLEDMQAAARLLLGYDSFFPFCKSDTDVNSMECTLFRSEWVVAGEDQWVYHIAANRFLRGMVRLIVGMCLNVGLGHLELATVRQALEAQERLARAESAPPQGLFLTEVRYPFPGP